MREHLSSAAQEKRPSVIIEKDGTLHETSSEDTDAYHRQSIGRTELGSEDFDPYHDRNSARMTAAAKLEESLLDLDERGADPGVKAEIQAALEIVATIEPDEERGLSRIGVAEKEVRRLEGWVRTFTESSDKRLETARQRLNSARLAVEALTAAEEEQSAINNRVTVEAGDDYALGQVRARIAMADAHNNLVRRNRHRRNLLKQAA